MWHFVGAALANLYRCLLYANQAHPTSRCLWPLDSPASCQAELFQSVDCVMMFSGTSISPWRQSYERWIPLPPGRDHPLLSHLFSELNTCRLLFLFHGTFLLSLHCFDVYLILFRVYPELGLQLQLRSLVLPLPSYQGFGWSLSTATATSVEMCQIAIAGSRRILAVGTGMTSSQSFLNRDQGFTPTSNCQKHKQSWERWWTSKTYPPCRKLGFILCLPSLAVPQPACPLLMPSASPS